MRENKMWDVVEGWRQTVNGFEVFAKSIDFVPHASKLSAFWIKNWKELFMALLIDKYYLMYKKHGIKVPVEVIKFTLEFQKQCDLYTDFISENLEETGEQSDTIDLNELYDDFKSWYEDTFSSHKYPSKLDFKKYLKKKYTGGKKVSKTHLKGFVFLTNKNASQINAKGY